MYTVQYLYTIDPAVENIAYHRFQLISVTLSPLIKPLYRNLTNWVTEGQKLEGLCDIVAPLIVRTSVKKARYLVKY